MSYSLIEKTESKRGVFKRSGYDRSAQSTAHAVWRCNGCKRMAVTEANTTDPGKCPVCEGARGGR